MERLYPVPVAQLKNKTSLPIPPVQLPLHRQVRAGGQVLLRLPLRRSLEVAQPRSGDVPRLGTAAGQELPHLPAVSGDQVCRWDRPGALQGPPEPNLLYGRGLGLLPEVTEEACRCSK